MSMKREPSGKLPRLLIVDDDPGILSQLGLALSREYEVLTADNPESAWEITQATRPDLITLDLALDGVNPELGFTLLEKFQRFDPFIKVVLITGNDDEINAMRAVEQGAADFFGKPVDVKELRVLLGRMLSLGRLERRNAAQLTTLGAEQRLGALVGRSPEIHKVFRKIEKVAGTEIPVLILGESGTGKELVAREIHRLSSRASKRFVKIDCGAIPENLIESELFGHKKGSFTSAHADAKGRLEFAEGGFVFLDEIGELQPSAQVKLHRFLQDREIQPVGGREVIKLDVRVIAATSRDLEKEIDQERFREDLYYRLSVVDIDLPPLRERPEDILFLAQYFLDLYSAEHNRGRLSFSSKAKQAIQQYVWPGNVRRLENRVRRAVVMSSGRVVDVSDLDLQDIGTKSQQTLKDARHAAEKTLIEDTLRRTGENVSKAAGLLGITRPTLYDKMAKYGITAKDHSSRRN
jgi:two-component system, NtrC family, response regulator